MPEKDRGALTGLRVLELGSGKVHYCGRLLADLGADVIKVEGPEGDPGRHRGPFKDNQPHPERSLYFLNFNTNKRSIILDLGSEADRDTLRSLVRSADALVESFPPGVMGGWGLDYPALREINPRLVMASVTGFGQWGRYSQYRDTDIVCYAMGGVMHLSSDPTLPPLNAPYELTYEIAAIHAAFGVLLALFNRLASGEGQYIEISIQEILASQSHNICNYSAIRQIQERRRSGGAAAPSAIYPCKDGYVHFHIMAPWHWKTFFQWMGSPEVLAEPVWENRHFRTINIDVVDPFVREFAAKYTKAELYREGQAKHLPVGAVNTVADFAQDPHVRERKFFVELEHPQIGPYTAPGAPFKLSETPPRVRRPAPLLGQHTREILEEVSHPGGRGRFSEEIRRAFQGARPPFQGVRVIDFTQAVAGPYCTRLMGEYGAEVIKVESSSHQQRGRFRPELGRQVYLQQKVTFTDTNHNKLDISLNMDSEEGRDILRRLVKVSDVFVENFSPRVMEKWGLDYPHLREIRPDIIMARLPGFGQTGPDRENLSVAATTMAVSGMTALWGHPEHPELMGTHVWLPDYAAGVHAAVALLSALHYRAATGRGQLLDQSQTESTAALLGLAYLDYFVNNHIPGLTGNRHPEAAPHGCYRCKGVDRWCAIACFTEEEWKALCDVMGNPGWTKDPKFADLPSRLLNQDELDRRLEEWTKDYTPHQVMGLLQQAGVPAGAVQNAEDLYFDLHLRERGFIVGLEEPDTGKVEYPGVEIRLSATPGSFHRCAEMGEHNEYVYAELLGISSKGMESLVEAGVLV